MSQAGWRRNLTIFALLFGSFVLGATMADLMGQLSDFLAQRHAREGQLPSHVQRGSESPS